MSPDLAHVIDMLRAAELITGFVSGVSERSFLADIEKQSAVLYQFAVLGEAANRVSAEFETAHPEVNWPQVVGFRNKILHQYHAVDLDIVWAIASSELPRVVDALKKLVPVDPNA